MANQKYGTSSQGHIDVDGSLRATEASAESFYPKHEVFASGSQKDEPFIVSLSLHEFTLSYGKNSQNL